MKNFSKQQGFTLFELLVAVSIFVIIMTAAAGIFANILKTQEQVLIKQLAMSNTSYALEYMSRAMRMAVKDENGTCLTNSGCNYSNSGSNDSVKFINHKGECVRFFLEEDSEGIGRIKYSNPSDFTGSKPFTPDELDVQSLKFNLNGECQADNLQPTVTIVMKVKIAEGATFKAQTTVTQRNLDIPR